MKAGEKYENLYFRVAQIDLFVHPKNMATSFDQSQETTFAKSRHNFAKNRNFGSWKSNFEFQLKTDHWLS